MVCPQTPHTFHARGGSGGIDGLDYLLGKTLPAQPVKIPGRVIFHHVVQNSDHHLRF